MAAMGLRPGVKAPTALRRDAVAPKAGMADVRRDAGVELE